MLSKNIIGEVPGNYKGTIIALTYDVEFVRYLNMMLTMQEGKVLPYDAKYDALLKLA